MYSLNILTKGGTNARVNVERKTKKKIADNDVHDGAILVIHK